MANKICSRKEKCVHGNRAQPYSNFYRDNVSKDSHKGQCIDCTTALRKAKNKKYNDIYAGRFDMFIG